MVDTKHVLLIEDDPDYKDLVKEALAGADAAFCVDPAGTLAEGLQFIERLPPDLILLDLNLPDSSGYSTFLRIQERAGGRPIVMLTGVDDDAMAVQAVQAGAQDYLVKSVMDSRSLLRSIKIALGRHGHAQPSHTKPAVVLGFIGSKGGVGTSTTTVNVAAWLAQHGWDTDLLELQPGPGTSRLYMLEDASYDLNSLLAKSAETITPSDLQECLQGFCGVRWLYAGVAPEPWRPLDAGHVTSLIAAARRLCSCVVLDLPPRVDEGVTAALQACDRRILVVDREPAAVRQGAEMLRQIRAATPGQDSVDLVVVDRACLGDRFPSSDIRRELRLDPLVTMRPSAAAICASLAARTPLVAVFPDDDYSRNIHELADRLMMPLCENWNSMSGPQSNYGSFWREFPPPPYD